MATLQQQINALNAQIASLSATIAKLTGKEASDIAALQMQIDALNAKIAALLAPSTVPAAVAGTSWQQRCNWNFGVNGNIAKFSDLIAAGWHMDATPTFLNNEVETYNNLDFTDANPNFQVFADHADIVAILATSGTPAGGNGVITSLAPYFNTDKLGLTSAPGYYEGTFKVPKISGAWPAWWMIGHVPGTADGYSTWGPEIDGFEFLGINTTQFTATLHGANNATAKCFLPNGGAPAGTSLNPAAVYQTQGIGQWNMGDFLISGPDYSQAFHQFGMKIAPDHTISIWVDGIEMGSFAAQQFCDDNGNPVVPHLIMNLALGDEGGTVSLGDFGGIGNTGPSNPFRLSVSNIQVWA